MLIYKGVYVNQRGNLTSSLYSKEINQRLRIGKNIIIKITTIDILSHSCIKI